MSEWHDIFCPRSGTGEPVLVTATTRRHRHAAERFARYFQREFGYDFAQYGAYETPWAVGTVPEEDAPAVYLMRSARYQDDVYVGAACFRWRVYRNRPAPTWALAWIWLHPYERRHGIATRAWPTWTHRHGAFLVEPPLSPAMRAFLQRLDGVEATPAAVELELVR